MCPRVHSVCLCPGEDTVLCMLGSCLNKSCQGEWLSLASPDGAAFACPSGTMSLVSTWLPLAPSPAKAPSPGSLGTKVMAPGPHSQGTTCFPENPPDSGPWTNFGMKCVLKAKAAVFMRGEQLYLKSGCVQGRDREEGGIP